MKADKAKSKLKSSSNLTLPLSLKKAKPTEAPPVPPIPAVLPDPSSPASSFPVTPSQRSDLQDMASDSPSDSRQRRASMPMNALSGSSQKQSQSRLAEQRMPSRSKIGMLGTIKKRLSVFGNDSRSSETPSPASVSPVRSTLVPHAPPSPLPSRDDEPVVVIDSREHSTSNAYGEQVGVWAAVSGNNPESNGDVTATEVPSTMTPMQAESSVSQLPAIQPGDSLSSTPLRSSSRTPPLSSVPFVGAGLAPALSHASPGAFIQPQHHETPPPVPDETDIYSSPTFPRASSHQSGSSGPVIGPVLSKTVSHEYQPTSDSPVSPSRLRSPSIRGPHVSPSAPRSRPTSITTSPSEAQSAVMPSGYPLSSRSDVASPATSGESSLFSYGNRGADHMSPFTSEGSRNSSMTSQAFDSKQMIHGERGIPPPGREDSRNSNETIHADLIGAATNF